MLRFYDSTDRLCWWHSSSWRKPGASAATRAWSQTYWNLASKDPFNKWPHKNLSHGIWATFATDIGEKRVMNHSATGLYLRISWFSSWQRPLFKNRACSRMFWNTLNLRNSRRSCHCFRMYPMTKPSWRIYNPGNKLIWIYQYLIVMSHA